MSKPKRKVCKCGWSGKTKANTCPRPLCRSPLSIHREKNGKVQRARDDKIEPTPELKKRRKAGEHDQLIDTLLARGQVSDIQAQAYQIFCNHRRTYYGKVDAQIAAYGESRGGDGPPDDVLAKAKAAHDDGLQAMGAAGSAAVYHLIFHNEVLRMDCLRAGLDALVSVYLQGQKKVA